jgi:hypothetical protein
LNVLYEHFLKRGAFDKDNGAATLVRMDNVVQYVYEMLDARHPWAAAKRQYVESHNSLNLAPPWPRVFFEATFDLDDDERIATPERAQMSKLKMRNRLDNGLAHFGMFLDFDSPRPNGFDAGWSLFGALYYGMWHGNAFEQFTYAGIITDEGRLAKLLIKHGADHSKFRNLKSRQKWEVWDNADIEDLISDTAEYHSAYNLMSTELSTDTDAVVANTMLYCALVAITFANCHNVKIREHTPQLTRQQRRHGGPVIVYRTLEIPGFVARYEGGAESSGSGDGGPRRFHLCRGHFAHHENLFGRLGPRTVWVPAHVKGSLEKGVVLKDYKVGRRDENQ